MFVYACLAHRFPPCDPTGSFPVRTCKSACEALYTKAELCSAAFSTATSSGLGASIARCNKAGETIGDAALSANFLYPIYLPAWKGEPYFVDDSSSATYQETDGMGKSAPVVCGKIPATGYESGSGVQQQTCAATVCSAPLMKRRLPSLVDTKKDLNMRNASNVDYCKTAEDCTNCTDTCVIGCPYPLLYSDAQYTMQWALVWVPGVLALPIVLLIIVSENAKLAGMKRKNITDRYMQLAAVFCLLHILTDSIPSMVLRNDMRCDGQDSYSQQLNLYGSKAQYVGRVKPNLLQALMFTVVLTLYKVRCQLKASLKMQRYTPGCGLKTATWLLIFVVPLTCYVANLVITSNPWVDTSSNYRKANGYPLVYASLYIPNDIRYQFTSGPKFPTVADEYLWVQVPLMVAGALALVLAAALLGTVYDMHASTNGKSEKGSDSTTKKLAWNMLRFAGAVIICVLLNAAATISYLPNALDFGLALNEFKRCALSGIPTEFFNQTSDMIKVGYNLSDVVFTEKDLLNVTTKCGFSKEGAPSNSLICLLLISQSLPDLLFGIVFAVPAIKQLASRIGKSMAKVDAYSANSSE